MRHPGLIAAAVLLLLVAGLGIVDVMSDPGTDFGAYFSHGWFISNGLAPYVDFWTHKAPLLPLVLAGWIAIFGTSLKAAAVFPLLVTWAAAVAVYVLGRRLALSRSTACGAAAIFVLFAAGHALDPTRNGVIVIAAVAFEMLAVIAALRGVEGHPGWLMAAGVSAGAAAMTRQTAIVAAVPVAAVILLHAGGRARRLGLAIAGGLAAAGVTALYFSLSRIPFSVAWEQLYRFNAIYASGHRMKLTWWVSEWGQVVWQTGFIACVAGVVWSLAQMLRRRDTGLPRAGSVVMVSMLAAHLLALYLSRKVQPMYLLQLLPEAALMTAIGIREVSSVSRHAARRLAVTAAAAAALYVPARLEAAHWERVIVRARSGSSTLERLGSEIRQLTKDGDRIWVCAANADALYPISGRLPAVTMTSVAGLVYPDADDFDAWKREFDARPPALVVDVYSDDFVRRYSNNPIASNGQNMSAILAIKRHLAVRLQRLTPDGQLPLIYTRGAGAAAR